MGADRHRVFLFLVIACFGITLGALWEVFERAVPDIAEPNPIVDIVMDTLGAVTASAAWTFGLISKEAERSQPRSQTTM
jgi:hypothetical protein